MKNAIIIPAYNEERYLGKVIDMIRQTNFLGDIIVINDGSKDSTVKVAKKKGVILIENKKNLGKSAAFLHGIKYVARNGYDNLLTIDGDTNRIKEGSIETMFQRLSGYSRRGLERMVIAQQHEQAWGNTIHESYVGIRGFSKKALIHLYGTKGKKFTHGFGLERWLDEMFIDKTKILKSSVFRTSKAYKHGHAKQKWEIKRMKSMTQKLRKFFQNHRK